MQGQVQEAAYRRNSDDYRGGKEEEPHLSKTCAPSTSNGRTWVRTERRAVVTGVAVNRNPYSVCDPSSHKKGSVDSGNRVVDGRNQRLDERNVGREYQL